LPLVGGVEEPVLAAPLRADAHGQVQAGYFGAQDFFYNLPLGVGQVCRVNDVPRFDFATINLATGTLFP
jgi:hypothetical protein